MKWTQFLLVGFGVFAVGLLLICIPLLGFWWIRDSPRREWED